MKTDAITRFERARMLPTLTGRDGNEVNSARLVRYTILSALSDSTASMILSRFVKHQMSAHAAWWIAHKHDTTADLVAAAIKATANEIERTSLVSAKTVATAPAPIPSDVRWWDR